MVTNEVNLMPWYYSICGVGFYIYSSAAHFTITLWIHNARAYISETICRFELTTQKKSKTY